MNWPQWTREPLVHFLVAGAVVFAFFTFRGEEVDPSSRVIEVDRDVQAELALRFERTIGRSPTDAELDQQIAQYVRDEVLYREALRLGLDQNDPVVRRRLVSKMDLAASARAEVASPSDATLRQWFENNAQQFAETEKFRFDQLYFSGKSDARNAVRQLQEDSNWQQLGDAISLPSSVDDVAASDLEARFGQEFMSAIDALGTGSTWQGPIQSGFGWHLVRLRGREAGATPEFEAVRDDVEKAWRTATIAERKAKAYDLLREAYTVEIDK